MPNRARGKHSKKGNEVVILVTDLEYNTGKMCERFFFSISNKRHGYAQCISLLRLITRKKATNFSSLCVYWKKTQKVSKWSKIHKRKCIYWNETFRLIFKHRVILSRKRNDLFNVGNFEAFLWLSFQRSGIRRVTTDKFYVRYVSYDITVECFKRLSLFQASTAFSTLWSLDMISLTSQECKINSSGTIIVVLSKLYYDYFRRSLSTRRKSDINSHRSAFTFSFNPQNLTALKSLNINQNVSLPI